MTPASPAESARLPLHTTELCQSCPLLSHLPLCHIQSCKPEGIGFSQKPCQIQVLVLPVTRQRTLHKTHKHKNLVLSAVNEKPDMAIPPTRKCEDKMSINGSQTKLNTIPDICFTVSGNVFGYHNWDGRQDRGSSR